MPTLATWMAPTLRAAGLTVVEHPGWEDRTRPGAFQPRAVMWHHDASPPGPSPNVPEWIATTGTIAAPAPLAQCWVDTDGAWHMLAAGRANHAGEGGPWGVVRADRGNEDSIGVETDHTTGEPWAPAQLDALRRGTAALLARLGADPRRALLGHKEYAPTRKTDPDGLDMGWERVTVAALMSRPEDSVTEETVRRIIREELARFAAEQVITDDDNPGGRISRDRCWYRAYSQARQANADHP